MTPVSHQNVERDELLKRIDELLWEDAYANAVRSAATIALELGELLREKLDDLQRAALDVAKAYWLDGGRNEQQRLELVEKIGMRRDKDVRDGTSRTPEGYANQVVWAALNTNTGLSGFAGEFLVEIGQGAGLRIDQIEGAFRRAVPALPRHK